MELGRVVKVACADGLREEHKRYGSVGNAFIIYIYIYGAWPCGKSSPRRRPEKKKQVKRERW